MSFRLVRELAADGASVAVACRVLQVSTSGYYEWRDRAPSARAVADAALTAQIVAIHARLMRLAQLHGIYRRRGQRRRPAPAVRDDLVQRRFVADAPDRLWLTDITEHPTGEGKIYCAAVLDVYSRRIVGWSIADHLRSELVVDALEMARWRRRPQGTIVHSDGGPSSSSRSRRNTALLERA